MPSAARGKEIATTWGGSRRPLVEPPSARLKERHRRLSFEWGAPIGKVSLDDCVALTALN